jgi:hypothetical protein
MARISGRSKRKLEAMGRVRPELMHVVYSHLTDEEAAVRVGEVVRSDRRAAEATLRYVRRARDLSGGYDADRAFRILVGAMNETMPDPIRIEDAELFARERELGWMPLSEAFERLRALVPELGEVRTRAEELADSPESFGIVQDTERDRLMVPAGVLPTSGALVGRGSRHPDPLIRSSVAGSVVGTYVTAVLTHTADRALWEHMQPRVTITGSFFEFGRG